MRISDWSSDVCSSDLDIEGVATDLQAEQAGVGLVVQIAGQRTAFFLAGEVAEVGGQRHVFAERLGVQQLEVVLLVDVFQASMPEIGRESCRARVCQEV